VASYFALTPAVKETDFGTYSEANPYFPDGLPSVFSWVPCEDLKVQRRMKKCGYCGRENDDQSDDCSECGTALTESPLPVRKPATEPQNRTWPEWLGTSLGYAGTLITIALLYLLSFGPVDRYCNKIVTRTSVPGTYTSNSFTSRSIVTVRYPGWVSIVYRPAIYLRIRSDLYRRYIALWNRGDDLI
jgi:hypothetical protein